MSAQTALVMEQRDASIPMEADENGDCSVINNVPEARSILRVHLGRHMYGPKSMAKTAPLTSSRGPVKPDRILSLRRPTPSAARVDGRPRQRGGSEY